MQADSALKGFNTPDQDCIYVQAFMLRSSTTAWLEAGAANVLTQ